MITFLEDKNRKLKKKYINFEPLTSIKESVDTVVSTGATTTSVTLSVACVGLIVVPISAGIACALSLGIEVL